MNLLVYWDWRRRMNWISVEEWVRQRLSNWYIFVKGKRKIKATHNRQSCRLRLQRRRWRRRQCQSFVLLYTTVDDKNETDTNNARQSNDALSPVFVRIRIGNETKRIKKYEIRNPYIFALPCVCVSVCARTCVCLACSPNRRRPLRFFRRFVGGLLAINEWPGRHVPTIDD